MGVSNGANWKMIRWGLVAAVLLLSVPAVAQCLPTPMNFPLTQEAVSTNFARLYGCFNGGSSFPSGLFTGPVIFDAAVTMRAALTLLGRLYMTDGVFVETHDGAFWIHTAGADAPAFSETNLGITTSTKRGVMIQRVLIGPENSGGIGYRMLRVPNLPTLQ